MCRAAAVETGPSVGAGEDTTDGMPARAAAVGPPAWEEAEAGVDLVAAEAGVGLVAAVVAVVAVGGGADERCQFRPGESRGE